MTSPIERVNHIERMVADLQRHAASVNTEVSREVSDVHRQTNESGERRTARVGRWVEALAENNGLLGGRARSAILAEMCAATGYIRRCACGHSLHAGKACDYATVEMGRSGRPTNVTACDCRKR